jgi:hypothetical protein
VAVKQKEARQCVSICRFVSEWCQGILWRHHSEVPRVYCRDFWKKIRAKIDKQKKEHRIDPFGSILWQKKNGKS